MNLFVTGRSIFAGGALVRDPEAKTAQVSPDAAVKLIKGNTLDALIDEAHRSGLTP